MLEGFFRHRDVQGGISSILSPRFSFPLPTTLFPLSEVEKLHDEVDTLDRVNFLDSASKASRFVNLLFARYSGRKGKPPGPRQVMHTFSADEIFAYVSRISLPREQDKTDIEQPQSLSRPSHGLDISPEDTPVSQVIFFHPAQTAYQVSFFISRLQTYSADRTIKPR